MQQLIVILHIIVCAFLILLVLMQHGKGADMGAAFGSGGANTMFGSQGSMPFMMKLTGMVAAMFFITSLSLSYLVAYKTKAQGPIPLNPVEQQAPIDSSPETPTN